MFTCVSVLEYLMSLQSHYFTLLNASIESITQIEMDLARFFQHKMSGFTVRLSGAQLGFCMYIFFKCTLP